MTILALAQKLLLSTLLVMISVAAVPGAERDLQRGVIPVALPKDPIYQDSWAVIIGINRYNNAPRLNYAVSDAKSVLSTLKELGFAAADKTVLLLDEDATKERIEQVLYGTLRASKRDDRVFVFFAGHGITVTLPRGGEEGYILPIDGDPENPALTAISMDDIRRISRWVPAKHILFSVDACYSGFAISRDIAPTKIDAYYLEAMTKEPAVQIITAGRKGEPVLEEEGHGLFTRRMIQGLTGLADTDRNGIITSQELATWLESRVIRDSQNRQHPQYARLSGEGQFVFVVPGSGKAPQRASNDRFAEERKRLEREAERLRWEKEIFAEQKRLQAEREALMAERSKFEEEKQRAELAKRKAGPETVAKQAQTKESAKRQSASNPVAKSTDARVASNRVTNVPPTVIPKPLSLKVESQKNELEIQEKVRLAAVATLSDGKNAQISEGINWAISDSTVASINNATGDVTAQKQGRVTVIARYLGLESQPFTLVVKQSEVGQSAKPKTNRAEIRKIITAAQSYRDQGEYVKAIAELQKAKVMAPGEREIDQEIENTRKACKAEQQLGLPVSC